MATAQFWDRIAAKYAQSPIRDAKAYEYTLGRTRSYLKPDDSVLEIGCGTGMTAVKLADAVARYTASDVSSAMVEIGRSRASEAAVKNLGFAVAGIEDPELPDGPFDAVLAFNLLHLTDDLDAALSRAAARIRPGGFLITKTVCLADPAVPFFVRSIMLVAPLMHALGRWPGFQRFTIARLEAAISRAGLQIIETGDYPARPPNRFIVARMP